MVRYPDTITVVVNPEYVQNEGSGNFEPVGEPVEFTSECRATPVEYNPLTEGPDGNMVSYDWTVSMPRTDKKFHYGDKVTLVKSEGTYSLTVKRQNNGDFNTVLWV